LGTVYMGSCCLLHHNVSQTAHPTIAHCPLVVGCHTVLIATSPLILWLLVEQMAGG
jgi:hypothetical protein